MNGTGIIAVETVGRASGTDCYEDHPEEWSRFNPDKGSLDPDVETFTELTKQCRASR